MTWKLISEHPIPNTIFDVLAKYYDATLDKMVLRRFCDCIQVDGRVAVTSVERTTVELINVGWFPVFWMEAPEPPHGFSDNFWATSGLPLAERTEETSPSVKKGTTP